MVGGGRDLAQAGLVAGDVAPPLEGRGAARGAEEDPAAARRRPRLHLPRDAGAISRVGRHR
jgi:hypothetical protein